MVFQSDPPLPEVHRPSHMTPSAHLRPHEYWPNLDPTVSETLSSSDSDDRVPLAELVKGKMGGVGSLSCEGVRGLKPALVVLRSRGQLCGRGGSVVKSGNQSSGFSPILNFVV